jgi:cell filamentation protein
VDFLHPFREGNGWAQRKLMTSMAKEKGWNLNLSPPDNAGIYERNMNGTIDGNIEVLADLIFECLSK